MSLAERLRENFAVRKLVYNDEKELQAIVAETLAGFGLFATREFSFDKKDCIDFFLFESGTGIEVKTEGGLHPILRQLKRYSEHPAVKELILVCPKPWSLPPTLTRKPIHCVSIFGSLI
jgi:hypothetical protein